MKAQSIKKAQTGEWQGRRIKILINTIDIIHSGVDALNL